ncbi:hypothetical protein GGX14DRAFT_694686 [Mycena pura]|uniref:Uncharacterized protein n=1 Tax=Mycena pura TaxID=153505 RepID=A0AAD6VT82_9AGAR|nr:hypothetical protein GGX14DRAFT_694686 [Mycena pura]
MHFLRLLDLSALCISPQLSTSPVLLPLLILRFPSYFDLFFQNKPAVGATFAIVGLIVAALLFALVTAAIRRRRAQRFDREIAEEAKRAPAPVFLDDDEFNNGGYSSYGTPQADPYAAHASEYPTSEGVHSTSAGTAPTNYMYPSGYSDLGFSDVSSQGTYAQPPMDGQYNPNAAYGGYGGGAAGAYEMTQYAQGQPQQEWGAHQGAYAYPGEEGATGYPPMAADPLVRSKSGGGARGLLDSSPPPQGDPFAKIVPAPQYADGYVAQYQTHNVEDGAGAYGGMESMHGHVGGMEDEGEEEEYSDGRRVLKVANDPRLVVVLYPLLSDFTFDDNCAISLSQPYNTVGMLTPYLIPN